MNMFPVLPSSSLTVDDVVSYLLRLKGDGIDVYQKDCKATVFFLKLNELNAIRISVGGGKCQVQLLHCENMTKYSDVSSLAQLDNAVASFARIVTGGQWPLTRSSARLSEVTPATNFQTIAQLIRSSKIEAIFDPFLENSALATLVDIMSFGGGEPASNVRLLGSTKKTSGVIPKFTKTGVEAWLAQLKVGGEGRVMMQKEHRRFMLLSGGRSLLLGHSINAIHKNEAIRIEADTEDRAFFDKEWAVATPLI
jgi:hypothetical protein